MRGDNSRVATGSRINVPGAGGVDSAEADRQDNKPVHKLAWLGGSSATFLQLVFCFRVRHPSCSDEIQAGGEETGTG